jgi:hypothetical protein
MVQQRTPANLAAAGAVPAADPARAQIDLGEWREQPAGVSASTSCQRWSRLACEKLRSER